MVPLCVSLGVSVFSCFLFFGFCGPAAGVFPSEECLLGGPFCSPAAGVFPSVECLFGGPFCGPAAGVFPSVECLFSVLSADLLQVHTVLVDSVCLLYP